MESDLLEAVASLQGRSAEFRDQVERMRAFKERMKDAGVEVRSNKFQISLGEGLVSPPPRTVFSRHSK